MRFALNGLRCAAAGGLLLCWPVSAAAQSSDYRINLSEIRLPALALDTPQPECDAVPPAEREKFDCPTIEGGRVDLSQIPLPALALEKPQLECDAVPVAEREKFELPLTCPESVIGKSEVSETLVLPSELASDYAPLMTPDGLPRRVLSLPGARLYESPGGAAADDTLPAFTIFYVYEDRSEADGTWVRVGGEGFGDIDGWLAPDQAEEWRTMLVMQFAPPGQRQRVLFFKLRDELIDFIRDDYFSQEAEQAREEIESGDYDDDYFVAMEPAVGVDPEQTYIMPIVDWKRDRFADGTPVTLLEVAGLNLDEAAIPQTDVREAENRAVSRRQRELQELKIQIALVIDTTLSMGPYIDDARATVSRIYDAFEKQDLLNQTSFALVGYRADTSSDPQGLEYVTRIFQRLDSDPSTLLKNFYAMRPAKVSTPRFSEDAFAGIEAALNGLKWDPFALGLIILVTDAGALSGFDPLAANPGYDAVNVVENAKRRNVAITAIHLLTPEAEQAGNIESAREQYLEITRTGDLKIEKYVGLDTSDVAAFKKQLDWFAQDLEQALETLQKGRLVSPAEPTDRTDGPDLGSILVNELFRAQLEYLGRKKGAQAPRFYRAWASDLDLVDPRQQALIVKVFLTRNQLSALEQGVDQILSAFRRQETSGKDFFEALQELAAETSVEGRKQAGDAAPADLLPSFLKALPYRSAVLRLTPEQWRTMGPTGQIEFTRKLESKLLAYRDIAADQDAWIDLGADDRGLEVHPIELQLFP